MERTGMRDEGDPGRQGDRADDVVSLRAVAETVREAAAASPAGRAARTLTPGPGGLRQTVLALTTGASLQEHDSPGPATLQVLDGRVRLTAGADRWELGAWDLVAIPPRRHALDAVDDAVVLLTVALAGRPAVTPPPAPPAGGTGRAAPA
jgi:quercetin dioxygenase-like cupin family protein